MNYDTLLWAKKQCICTTQYATIQHMKNVREKFLISVAPVTRIALVRDQSFFYTFSRDLPIGTLVEIPIGKRTIEGIVTDSSQDFPRESTFALKKITRVTEESFMTHEQLQLAFFISTYYICPLGIVLKHFIPKKMGMRGKIVHTKRSLKEIMTTPEQNTLIKTLYAPTYKSFYFHTISQSDKIGVLFSLIKKINNKEQNGQSLYLLPELIQTPYFTDFFHRFFTGDEVAILHSKLPKGEFYKKWCDIRTGKIKFVIGTRIALFAPFQKLGAIIVDEAHDMSHKQWDHSPLYDVRTASKELARIHDCLHILTSATPRTVDFYHTIHRSDVHYISHNAFHKPVIELVDMKKERWDKNKSPLSRTLVTHIKQSLKNKKQILLFVNRQGMSAFSICTKCRTVLRCPECTHALISVKSNTLLCIQCHKTYPSSKKCDRCKAPIEHIGIGTQRIQKELAKIFPSAQIALADTSTMHASGAHRMIYDDFCARKIDIIIGTQMITKSWHTENVGLCGIIDADHLLSLPDYNTNEKTFAFIVQMALRTKYGKLIVQTFQPENPILSQAQKYDFDEFHKDELSLRKILSYPPYTKIIKLTYKDVTRKNVEYEVDLIYDQISKKFKRDKSIIISEPHFPLIDKVRSKYRKQFIIKIKSETTPKDLYLFLCTLDIKWSVDVDPIQLI